jgi:hypothetical protein
MRPFIVRGIAVWFVLMGAEFAHGIVRAIWLVPVVGDFQSRQIGVFTGTIINLTIAALFIPWVRPTRVADALGVGVMWLVLTVDCSLSGCCCACSHRSLQQRHATFFETF